MNKPNRFAIETLPTTGFAPPRSRLLGRQRRTAAVAELIATVALVTSTLAVATVLSLGLGA